MLVRTTDDRSRAGYDGCSDIVLPCCGQPVAMVTCSCSMRSSAVAGVERAQRDQRGTEVQHLEQRGDQPADPEERHRREDHVVGSHRVPRLQVAGVAHDGALRVDGALGLGGAAGAVHDRPAGRRVRRTPPPARGTPSSMPARSPASTIDASSPRDQARSDAPHTWMARRNGASARTNRSSARLAGEAGERRFEAFEVVVGEEARVGEELGEVGVTDRPSELARLRERVQGHEHGTDTRRRERGDRRSRRGSASGSPPASPCRCPAASRPWARAAERASAAA